MSGNIATDWMHGSTYADMLNFYTGTGKYDPTNAARAGLTDIAKKQSAFGDQAQGNYAADTGQANQTIGDLRKIANGQNSVSAMQLAQAQQANQAQQASMAAGASPNNQAMASRNAMMNASRANYGMAGQQAVAGQQERNAATSQLGGLIGTMRGQDANAATAAGQNATNAYGQQIQNPQKTEGPMILNAFTGALGGMAMSDRRAKHEIADGDDDADSTLKGLRAFTYKYKDEKNGKGKQLGVMAQDLERTPLKSAVVNTSDRKYVDGAKLALGLAAILPGIDDRLSKLERDKTRNSDGDRSTEGLRAFARRQAAQ